MDAISIKKNHNLNKYNTFKTGGKASFFVEIFSKKELLSAIKFAKENDLKIFILGGGSNVLFSDKGFRGLVIKISIKGIKFNDSGVEVYAGEEWDEFVKKTLKRKLYGLENLSGIPGSVGATPIQNVGAYGVEVSKYIKSAEALDIKSLKTKVLYKEELNFGYRNSFFKSKKAKKYIILKINFSLDKKFKANFKYKDLKEYFKNKHNPTAQEIRKAVLSIRRKKFPDLSKIGTAGSFFKNPIISERKFNSLKKKYPDLPSFTSNNNLIKVSLAFILDKVCSFKGYRLGNVGLYKHQPLVVVNYGKVKSKDILKLQKKIEKKVYNKTKIKIKTEVVFVK